MSLSAPKLTNPCKKFIEFKGGTGIFQYWDKESEKNIELEYPIQFIVLDELSTIKGYNKTTNSGVYSNEVRSIKNQTLHVKTFKGNLELHGKYSDIKADILGMGGKYCKSVYAALLNRNELELTCFQLTGISNKAWIDKEFDVSLVSVKIEDCSDGKNGNVKFKIPNYKGEAISKELMDKAVAMDKDLQVFLKSYQDSHKEEVDESVQEDGPCEGDGHDGF